MGKKMALIKCPDCLHEVSDKAELCPNCAYPIAKSITSVVTKTVTCLECEKEFPFHDEVCPYCGFFNYNK